MLAKLIEQGNEDQAKTIMGTGKEEMKDLIPKFYKLNALMPSKWNLPQASPTDSYINITETVWIIAVHKWTKKLRMEEEKRLKEELKSKKGKKPKAPKPKEKQLNLKQKLRMEEEKRLKEELKRKKGKKPKAPKPKEKPLNLKQKFLNKGCQAPQKAGAYLKHLLGAKLGGRYYIFKLDSNAEEDDGKKQGDMFLQQHFNQTGLILDA
jgi:hypothetical protein